MSVFKSMPGNRYTLNGMIEYVTDEKKSQGILTMGFGVNPNPIYAFEEMRLVKDLYNKPYGRQYKQYMLSFDRDVSLGFEEIKEIAYRIGQYYANDYQIIMSAHFDTNNLHLQYALNTINVHTGRKFEQGPSDLKAYKEYINSILADYDLNLIHYYIPEENEISIDSLNHLQ